MKQTHVNKATPVWVKRLFCAFWLILAIIGVAVIPIGTYALVKEILGMIGETEAEGMAGLLGFLVFVAYIVMGLLTNVFGLANEENWS